MCGTCGVRPATIRGMLCNRCNLRQLRDAGPLPVVPGLMTPEEADARRQRIITKMRAEGHTLEEINERFGGRGVRGWERTSGRHGMVEQ